MRDIKFDLMPACIKKQMRMIKTVGIFVEIVAIALLAVMGAAGFFHDLVTGCVFSVILLLITTPLLVPGFVFNKVSQSTVSLEDNQIRILDSRRRCWRCISYNEITAVRVEDVGGFFYGQNKELYRNQYICVFLNDSTDIPNVSFANLFSHQDFIMFGYHEKAWDCICHKLARNRTQNAQWKMEEFSDH